MIICKKSKDLKKENINSTTTNNKILKKLNVFFILKAIFVLSIKIIKLNC